MQAPMPWTTEHCVALARCMSRMGQLQDVQPDQLPFEQVSNVRSYYMPCIIRAVSICTLSSHLRCSYASFCHAPPAQERLCPSMLCLCDLLQWPLSFFQTLFRQHCEECMHAHASSFATDTVCSLKLKLCKWYFSYCLS